MQIGICYDNHSYTETLHTNIKRMLKRYKGQYTVMKRILIDIQRSYAADLISYVYTMYPYPELSGACIPVVPKTAYATIADQFCVISMQYTTPHTVCLRAVNYKLMKCIRVRSSGRHSKALDQVAVAFGVTSCG